MSNRDTGIVESSKGKSLSKFGATKKGKAELYAVDRTQVLYTLGNGRRFKLSVEELPPEAAEVATVAVGH